MLRFKPVSKIILDKVLLQKSILNMSFEKLQNKFFCEHCNGKGYNVCSCSKGCKLCNYSKISNCNLCHGVGFIHYTYF